MRILLCIEHWELIGGSERYAGVLARALAERGHEIGVLCARTSEASGAMGRADIARFVLPHIGDRVLPPDIETRLRAHLAEFRPEVILVLTAHTGRVFDTLLEHAPVVRWVQDHTLFCPGLNKVYEDGGLCNEPLGLACLMRYWVGGGCSGFKPVDGRHKLWESAHRVGARLRDIDRHKRAACLIVASRYMEHELWRAGFAPEQVVHIPYFTLSNSPAVARGALPQALETFLRSDDRPVLFTPARLTLPDKGVDYLITALAEVSVPFKAVVAGSGPAEPWLRAKAEREGLAQRMHFSGWIDAGAIESLYPEAAIVICPSMWNEPFGLVGLEAMAHAKPTIAFAVGGIPDWLVDGDNGFLIERGDTHAMARAIERLLADPALARAMGVRGRERGLCAFSKDAHCDEVENVLHAALRA